MSADSWPVSRGWRVRIAALWAATFALVVIGVALLAEYGRLIFQINEAYLREDLQPADFDALNDQWVTVDLLSQIATSLIGAAFLLAILVLVTQARGWELRRELARSPRPDRLGP